MGRIDYITVSRQDRVQVQGIKSLQRSQVVAHAAIGGIDDDRRSIDDVITREQPVQAALQVAQMV